MSKKTHSQKKETINTARILSILLLSFFIFSLSGCSAKKPAMQHESESAAVHKSELQHPAPEKVSPLIQKLKKKKQFNRQITAIDINKLKQFTEINISGNAELKYNSVKKNSSHGLTIYLPKTKIAKNFKNNTASDELIKNIIVEYADPDMTMVKIGFMLTQTMDYTLNEADNKIQLILHKPAVGTNENFEKVNLKNPEQRIFKRPEQYTGEKVKLDFYETDIKNVFRMLKRVAGINFAIDKDVEGTVTLSLENPVPWDQILDLVLKMNGLGYKQEGNIIRIATLDTLKKEQLLLQDIIEERNKAKENEQKLEPLETEYIPISYADAEKDIKPHINQILTKNRGRISVDKRTNTIIITEIRSKLDQVREIIYRLDQVTPQIMIEARVVEVTKSFSRELGMGLAFTRGQIANTVTNTTDYTVALNYPFSAPLNAGIINVYNVLGSKYSSLQAQIKASETKGELKIISSPRILTLDNKKAYIKQGMEYAYLERDSSGGASVKFKDIDLLLSVTPHVTPDKRIAMTVHLTKNDIASITDGIPSLSTNEAETELLVNNKDTIVIGGIEKQTDNTSASRTPFLAAIPLIGRFFRTDTTEDNRNELLIFLTPSIIQLEQKRDAYGS